MIGINLPKLSEYDPIRSAEGAIDPLGLYTIADRLAIRLVPGIRERMSHPRFLTAMTVGTVILRDYDEDDCLTTMTEKRGKISAPELSKTNGCMEACKNVPKIFEEVADRLLPYQQSDNFEESFGALSISTNSEEWTNTLLEHHIKTQRRKPPNGKNPWFERFDDGAVVIRPGYRRTEGGRFDDSYVHAYRTKPLRSFISDLGMPN